MVSSEERVRSLSSSSGQALRWHGNELTSSKASEMKHFSCTFCPYRATQKGNLQRHIRGHTGEKPFTCHLCPYSAKQKLHLDNHIRTHTGEKPFVCPKCSYRTNQDANLRRHITCAHSSDKPYTCSQCSHRSKSLEGLRKHVCQFQSSEGNNFLHGTVHKLTYFLGFSVVLNIVLVLSDLTILQYYASCLTSDFQI